MQTCWRCNEGDGGWDSCGGKGPEGTLTGCSIRHRVLLIFVLTGTRRVACRQPLQWAWAGLQGCRGGWGASCGGGHDEANQTTGAENPKPETPRKTTTVSRLLLRQSQAWTDRYKASKLMIIVGEHSGGQQEVCAPTSVAPSTC